MGIDLKTNNSNNFLIYWSFFSIWNWRGEWTIVTNNTESNQKFCFVPHKKHKQKKKSRQFYRKLFPGLQKTNNL